MPVSTGCRISSGVENQSYSSFKGPPEPQSCGSERLHTFLLHFIRSEPVEIGFSLKHNTMRKTLLFLLLLLFSVVAWSQGKTVDFHFMSDGSFIREDSDKNYYVFEFEGMSEQQVKETIERTWRQLPHYPKSFIGEGLRLTLLDGQTYTAESRHHIYNISSDVLFHFRFNAYYKEGKLRIDAPQLIKVTVESGGRVYYPNDWAVVKFGPLAKKTLPDVKIMTEYAVNTRINQLLAYMEPENSKWDDPIILESSKARPFQLVGSRGFVSSTNPSMTEINISLPGLTKDKILTLVRAEYMMIVEGKKAWQGYDSIITDAYPYLDGLQVTGSSSLVLRDSFLASEYKFWFRFFLKATDGVLKVYAPQIYQVDKYTVGKKSFLRTFHSFDRFLSFQHYTSVEGVPEEKAFAKEALDDMELFFNRLVFEPLFVLQQAVMNREEVDDDW